MWQHTKRKSINRADGPPLWQCCTSRVRKRDVLAAALYGRSKALTDRVRILYGERDCLVLHVTAKKHPSQYQRERNLQRPGNV
jgi:hypothetical protein